MLPGCCGEPASRIRSTGLPWERTSRLLSRETVEVAVAAGALERVLAAALRRVRRVPRLRRGAFIQPRAVVVTDDRRALAALGPVAAGRVAFVSGQRASFRRRTGQHIVHVRFVATAVDDLALLGERGLLVDVGVAVQVLDVLGHDLALGVLPWALADAIARIGRRALA